MTIVEPSTNGSSASYEPFHVVIIGAGLGGLCLAHGLTKTGIRVTVYERDRSASVRGQGYRISLKSTGVQALRHCLPARLFDLCRATSLRPATRMVFADSQLRPKFAKPIPPVPPSMGGFGVNRLTLREILLADLGVRVCFGKTFHHYQPTADGRVAAWFTDDTGTTADLLVGADGTNSAVRAQLLPGAIIDELKWMTYGRTPITPDTMTWMPDLLVDTFNRVIGDDGDTAFAVATCRAHEPVAAATVRLAPGPTLTEVPDYLQWLTPLPDHQFRAADAATLHRLAADLVRGWHPAVRRIIAEADIDATFPVCVTSARPVLPWANPAVTLLGDAIHTMSPGRGDGANIALRDAQLLSRMLARAATGEMTLTEAKQAYEADMLEYGFAAVTDSLNHPFSKRLSAGTGAG